MVKYLSTYINNRKNRGCAYVIDIKNEVERYKSKYPGKTPVVIFDFMACLSIPVLNNNELFCGGRQPQCTQMATKFCEKFKELGIEMIFFIDGPIKQNKIPTYLRNCNTKYDTQQIYFNTISKGEPIPIIKSNLKLSIYFNNFLQIVRKYAKIYISLENECDLDLAEYATRINAMAVFTPDTDFLIFAQDWQIWSSVKFRLNNFTTLAWNKLNLRKKLGLAQRQMPIFSTLSGNDYFTYDEVKHIIDSLEGEKPQQEKLAEYIRKIFPKGVVTRLDMEKLIELLYKNGENGLNRKETEIKIKKSLDFYDYSARKIAKIEGWLKNHIQHTNSIIVYIILKDFPITINQSWINLKTPNVKSFSELVIPIVQRQMGIILYNKKNEKPKRTLYYKPNHIEPFQSNKFEGIYPNDNDDFIVPQLTDLLYLIVPGNDIETDNSSQIGSEEIVSLKEKFQLLSWLISPISNEKINYELLLEICQSPFLIPSMICYGLIKEKQITIDEADVILLSINEAINSTNDKLNSIKSPDIVNERPFWISVVYNRLVDIMRNSLVICGLFKYVTISYFDGYIFHKMYKQFLNFDSEKKNEIIEVIKKYRIYIK